MYNFLSKSILFLSLICINYGYATQENPYSSNLELRNEFASSAIIRVHPHIPVIEEGPQAPMDPICIILEAAKNGVKTQQIHSFPKRYGFVTIEINGGCKFYGVVDLRSIITVELSGTVLLDLILPLSAINDNLPDWLYNSITFKRVNLSYYVDLYGYMWKNLSEADKLNPGMTRILDIPWCLLEIPSKPQISTPFPHCLNSQILDIALKKYKQSHPEFDISKDEIRKAEQVLIEAGVIKPHEHDD